MSFTATTTTTHKTTGSQAISGVGITRKVGSVTHTLTYDAENRLTKVMNGATTIATFVYDGDGQRVKSTLNGVTTSFVGNYYEKTGKNSTKYYYAGTARVAMRNTSVKYLFGDQLGSTSVTTSSSGAIGSQARYKPYGEMYYTSGTLPTRYTFTGQYSYANTNEIGLMYYGARFYDPVLGRFASADTIIPGAGNPQSWDRFAYTLNNPVKYTDPSGHMISGEYSGDVDPDVLAALYQKIMNNDYGWDFSGSWTLQEVKEVRQAAQDIGAYIGSFGGNGQAWIKAHLGGVTFAKERFIKYPIRAMNGGYTYLEFSLNGEIHAGAFVFPSNQITFQNSSINSQTVVHELGHTLDNWLGSSTVFEAAIFGGGWSDAQIQYLGGQPYGLRCSTPHNLIKEVALPKGDYGNVNQADFFAQHFKYQVYGYPGNYNGGTAGMWMHAFIGITVNMLP